jgi:hypothetical protein
MWTAFFWVVTQRVMKFLTDVSGQPIGPIVRGQEHKSCLVSSLRNYHCLLRNNQQELSSHSGFLVHFNIHKLILLSYLKGRQNSELRWSERRRHLKISTVFDILWFMTQCNFWISTDSDERAASFLGKHCPSIQSVSEMILHILGVQSSHQNMEEISYQYRVIEKDGRDLKPL